MDIKAKISKTVLDNFNPPDELHASWWLNPDHIADEIIALFGVEWGTEYEVDNIEAHNIIDVASSEHAAREIVANSPHDTGLRFRIKASEWEEA